MTPDHKNNRYRPVFHKKTPRQSDLKNLLTKSEIDAKKQEAEKNRAEKEKAENESKKALEDKSKITAEKISAYAKLTIGFATAYGFILLLLYCHAQAKFLPSGLSIGDSALLLFFAIAFGTINFLIAGMAAYTFQPIITYGKKKYIDLKDEKDKLGSISSDIALIATPFIASEIIVWILHDYGDFILEALTIKDYILLGFFFIILIFAAIYGFWTYRILPKYFKRLDLTPESHSWFCFYMLWFLIQIMFSTMDSPWFAALYVQASGLVLASLQSVLISEYSRKKEEIKYPNARTSIAVCIGLLLGLPILQWSEIGSIVFSNSVVKPLGLYQERASLWVSKSNLETLEDAAKIQDIPLSVCKNPDGSAVVTDLRIWWHGIGSRSYVQLLGFSDQEKQKNAENASAPAESEKRNAKPYDTYPKVELKGDEARLIASQNVRCTEISDALVFPSNETKPYEEPSVQVQLAKQIKPFIEISTGKEKSNQLFKIQAIGHADPMPVTNDSNEALGRKRAIHALSMLCDDNLHNEIGNPYIEIKTMGARSPLKDCSSIKDKSLAIECNASNRRVDLRFSYSKTPASKNESCDLKKDTQGDITLDCFCKSHPAQKNLAPKEKPSS